VFDTEGLVQRYWNVDVCHLPKPASRSDFIKQLLDRAFVCVDGYQEIDSPALQHKEAWKYYLEKTILTDSQRKKLLLYFACRHFNVGQKLRELTRIEDPIKAEIGEVYEQLLQDKQPLRACFQAMIMCRERNVLPNLVGLVARYIKSPLDFPEAYDVRDLTDELEINAYCNIHWQQWCRKENETLAQGIIRDFSINAPKDLKVGDYFCPIGLNYNTKLGGLFCESVHRIDHCDVPKTIECVKHKLRGVLRIGDWPRTWVQIKGRDTNGQLEITAKRKISQEVFEPRDLPSLLRILNKSIEDVCEETAEITSGVNMASELSFPVLNGTCLGCSRELKRLCPQVETRLYGDDVLGKGPSKLEIPDSETDYPSNLEHPADCLEFLRGNFGMVVKKAASGRQKKILSVFTERFFDVQGNEYFGVKPHSFLKLFHACHPERTLLNIEAYPSDYRDLVKASQKVIPNFDSFMIANGLSVNSGRIRKRTTSSRHFILQVLRSTPPEGDVVRDDQVEQLVLQAEEHLFTIAPPRRGKPYDKGVENPFESSLTKFQLDRLRDVLNQT
jgi:hypothetical protein